MPALARVTDTNTIVSATLTNATETVIALITSIANDVGPERVRLLASASITPGADTTAITLRLRRGTTIAGTLVQASPAIGAAATAASTYEVSGVDLPSGGMHSYVLTGQATAASATSAVSAVSLIAMVGP